MKFLTTLFLVTIIFQSNAQLENRSGEFALDKIKYINLIANLDQKHGHVHFWIGMQTYPARLQSLT